MQLVRTIVESNCLEAIVDIPEELKDQKVEILILPFPAEQPGKKNRKSFNPDEFEGILNIDPTTVEEEIKLMRDEWERF